VHARGELGKLGRVPVVDDCRWSGLRSAIVDRVELDTRFDNIPKDSMNYTHIQSRTMWTDAQQPTNQPAIERRDDDDRVCQCQQGVAIEQQPVRRRSHPT